MNQIFCKTEHDLIDAIKKNDPFQEHISPVITRDLMTQLNWMQPDYTYISYKSAQLVKAYTKIGKILLELNNGETR